MYVYLLLAGVLLYGPAAFAGSRVLVPAGIVLAIWLAVLGVGSVRRAIASAAHR